MTHTTQSDEAQATLWNGAAGRAWVALQDVLDAMLQPFEDCLVDAGMTGFRGRVLDIGCGTGSTTLAVARRLGDGGRCIGIDLSAPMLAAARERAARQHVSASFLCGDAQTHPFAPGSIDHFLSRFGVMFFNDPVQAFANLRRAASDGATCRFVAWRSAAENPFMTAAERAAAPLLPDLPARRPEAPGQFAFADRQRIERVLAASGWVDIDIRPIDEPCALQEVDAPTRARVIETVRAAFDPFVHGADVRFDAACWWVAARTAPSPVDGGRR
ncbi:MAG: class I SAM-dependent methyltransferase [Burkholderiales bacterium]